MESGQARWTSGRGGGCGGARRRAAAARSPVRAAASMLPSSAKWSPGRCRLECGPSAPSSGAWSRWRPGRANTFPSSQRCTTAVGDDAAGLRVERVEIAQEPVDDHLVGRARELAAACAPANSIRLPPGFRGPRSRSASTRTSTATPRPRSIVPDQFHGVLPALITPFTEDGADLDAGALAAIVERLVAACAGGLVPGGSTGEFTTLSHGEQQRARRGSRSTPRPGACRWSRAQGALSSAGDDRAQRPRRARGRRPR